MSDLERNKELVVEFWHAPFDDRERFLTDEVVWHLPPSVRINGIDMDVHTDGIAALFEMGFATYEAGMTWDVQHVLAEGDLVALHCTMRGRTASGNVYHGPSHMLFRIEGERIAEAWEASTRRTSGSGWLRRSPAANGPDPGCLDTAYPV